MCEILGFSQKRKTEINRELDVFYSHAPEHPNGWGLALFDGRDADIKRECVRADKSPYLMSLLARQIRAKDAIAHIRLATIGVEDIVNCHPFVRTDRSGRRWTLAHNGTIFEYDALNRYVFLQQGETDSERLLLYLIDRMDEAITAKGRGLTARERFLVLDDIVCRSSPKNKLNLLIYDGEVLYVHTNFKDSLYLREDDAGATFSTQPLTDEHWENVPLTTLFAYRDGERIFTGTDHKNEYFFDENSYKPLFLAYSGL